MVRKILARAFFDSLHKSVALLTAVAVLFTVSSVGLFVPEVALAAGPTFDSTISGPANGTTNVPTSANIHIGFTGNLNQSTISTTNITLTNTTASTPVSISVRSFPNGFDITPSSPPTYTTGTNFSKLTTVSTGFFFMQGTTTITPQGAYASPSAGDIVYFQNQSFPIQLGIVTNATLTSGTFSVNNFNLFGGQQITKVATPAATGAVSGTTVLTTGDLIVMNATANPTDASYNWHLVTTGAAINAAGLRVDSGAAAPTFVSGSSFSTITPNATSAVDGSSQLTLNLAAGDLVFAKVTANADNLNRYAWHVVTTAENISGAVPSTLRLDNGAAAPTFAASTQVSKLTPAATGLVTATTPALSYGDIVFAKTTANASNNGSYNFHLITTPAPSISNTALRFDNAVSSLSASTNYTVGVTTGLQDGSSVALASPLSISFTTGANIGTNTTPPFVQSSTPQGGSVTFPIGAPISLQFSVPMDNSTAGSVLLSSNIGLFTNVNGATGAAVTAVNTYNTTTNTVTITPSTTLTPAQSYIVKVFGTTKSSTGIPLPPYQSFFTTASGGVDTTRPTVLGVFPSPGAAAVARPVGDISIGFSKDMNPATIASSTITVGGVTGAVTYSPQQRAAHFSPTVALARNTPYTVTVAATVTDLSGNLLGGNNSVANAVSSAASNTAYVFTFTTADVADSVVRPTIQFANADNFGIAVTFSGAMKSGGGPSAADNIANYTLESPVGTTISLAGKTIIYDGPTMTAKITGLSLQNGIGFKITGSNTLQDLGGNFISTALGPPVDNVSQGMVADSTMTGGQLGPGGGMMQTGGMMGMSPIRVSPMNRSAGATSNYFVEMPVTTSIPVGGSIVLTFPTGFDVTNAAAMTAGTESPANSDINGPAPGVVTIASVTANAAARTVTIVTGGAVTGANAFLHLDLKNIVNSSVPSSAGYTVDVKTKDASNVILETKTSGSFYLGQAGTNTLTVNVFNDNGGGGGIAGNNIKDGTEPGIANATVFLFSPSAGGQSATTNGSGVASFSNLNNGTDYMIGIEPSSVGAGGFAFNSAPQPLSIAGSTTKNFGLLAAPYTIAGTITGPINTKLDVFASSFNGYVTATVDTGSGGSVAYSLPAQANTTYRVGVGPSIPKTFAQPGSAMPPPPTFTFMPPPVVEVAVVAASVSGKNFALTSTTKTIVGTVNDASGTGINKAQIFARPVQNSTDGSNSVGFGTGGETDTQGNFSLRVVPGVYLVGVFKPGMPNIPDKQITVPATGANTPTALAYVINASTGLTISGKVTDDAGNPIPYAGVGGRKVTSTTNTTSLGGGSDNFVGGPTDANGAYTLYVTAGTWVIESYAPGFGRLGSKTITVASGTSLTGQDFSASTLSTGTITGTARKASVAQQGVMVRANGANGGNMAITDASGNYTLKVPAGTGYSISCFFPGVGESTPVTGVNVTSGVTTSGQDCSLASPITLTVNLTNGTTPITGAFVDARDSNGRGNGTGTYTTSGVNAVYVLTLSPGTYTIRAGHPAYGMLGSTANISATGTITYTATVGATSAVTGTITGGGAPLNGAWVSLNGTPTGQTNIINVGGQTASDGTFSISVPKGSYRLRADKPGYKSPAQTTVTVTGATVPVGTIDLTAATLSITGQILLNSAGVSGAFVNATDGTGGFTVSQTDANGNYSLAVSSGTWTIRAGSMGYEGGPLTVTVGSTNSTGNNITLTALSGFTVKPEKQETVTPNSGGFFINTDIGDAFKVNIPANALGTGANASTIKTQNNTSLPNPPTGTILKKNAVTISATDAAGQPVKSLSSPATIVIPYTVADLPAGTPETGLVIGVWNDATSNYDTLPTTVDTTAKTLTATVTHFSDFAPLVATGGASDTPSGFVASVGSASQINLSWTVVSGATSYDIYRSTSTGGTFARLGSEPTVSDGSTVTYSDLGLTAATAYYYKITSLNASGESALSSIVTAQTTGGGGGGGGRSTLATPVTPATTAPATTTPTTTPATTPATTTPSASVGQQVSALIAQLKALVAILESRGVTVSTQVKSLLNTLGIPASGNSYSSETSSGNVNGNFNGHFDNDLKVGSKGDDVSALQKWLIKKGYKLSSGATGYFGAQTKAAVKAYQKANGITPASGMFGQKTRAHVEADQ